MAEQAPHITRDQDLWFEDGNIVVVANGTWAFRVYKGMLARISLVFEDTFKFSPGGQTMDGAPVFHVHDHPIDLKHFLQVAFSPAVDSLRLASLPFTKLASVIRIAHKYEADAIFDAALSRLESFFVPGPGHWLDADPAASWDARLETGQQQCCLTLEPEDAFAAAELARLTCRPRTLPVALFLCCLCDPRLLRHGARRGVDGAVAALDDADFARCVRAGETLRAEGRTVVHRALGAYAEARWAAACKCRKVVDAMFREHARDEGLCTLEDLFVRVDKRTAPPAAWKHHGDLCGTCKEDILERFETECRAVRKKLPTYFSLEIEGWE